MAANLGIYSRMMEVKAKERSELEIQIA